jgi:hypothetical protein
MTSNNIGVAETGNRPWVSAVVTAPNVPGHLTDASTAITFNMVKPDGTLATPVSSPNADIVGPTAGTVVVNGVTLTTTTWFWKVPTLTLAGDHVIRWTSTAGCIAQDNSRLVVPSYAPFLTP